MPRSPGIQGNDAVLSLIMVNVAAAYGVDPDNLTAHTRRREICEPRMVVASIAYTLFDMKGDWLASRLGFNNHSSVIHASRVTRSLHDSDKAFRERLYLIASAANIPCDKIRVMVGEKYKVYVREKVM